MYDRQVLTPRFDVFEFAKRYEKRAIDVDEEGYEIIREVRKFFEAYPIEDRRQVPVTSTSAEAVAPVVIPIGLGGIAPAERLGTRAPIKAARSFFHRDVRLSV